MTFNFDETLDHRYDHSYRWAQPEGRDDVIGMGTADMDYHCAPAIKKALAQVAEENTYNYRMKSDQYYDGLTNFYRDRYGLDVQRDWLFNVPGTLAAIRMIFGEFSNPGDYIITQTPYFEVFKMIIEDTGRQMLLNPMPLVNGHYEIDFEDFEAKIKQYHPSIFLLINPQNPTGRVFTREELARLAKICYENHVLIVSDEVHGFITFDGHCHTPILAVSEEAAKNSILVVSFSKGYNMMSIPHAVTIASDPIIQARWLHQAFPFDFQYASNSFALAGVTAAVSPEGQAWLRAVNAYLEENLNYFISEVERRGLPLVPIRPEGSFVIWIDCRKMGLDPQTIEKVFLDKAGIALNNGLEHGEEGSGFIRMNFAVTRAVLNKALDRIEGMCRSL